MMDPQLLVAVTGFTHFVEGSPKYLTVADHERAQAIPRKIRLAVRHYVMGTEWPGLELEKVEYDWKRLSKAITALDPDDTPAMEKLIDGLPTASEETSGGYVGALQRVIAYVNQRMPHNADVQMTGIRQREPSPLEVYRWGRVVMLAEEPLYVLEWMHAGRLTFDAIDCMEETYPTILDMMRSAAVTALADAQMNGAWNLPRVKSTQLSLLLGSFAAPGLQQAIQAMLADEAGKKQAQKPAVKASSKVADSYHGTSGKEA
jgi:hypothetical protein